MDNDYYISEIKNYPGIKLFSLKRYWVPQWLYNRLPANPKAFWFWWFNRPASNFEKFKYESRIK